MPTKNCSTCNGTGRTTRHSWNGSRVVITSQGAICRTCNGSGKAK